MLYKIVSKLTGSAVNNPVPEHESDKVLAEKFVEFFMKKIKMIRQNLDSKKVQSTRLQAYLSFFANSVKSQKNILKRSYILSKLKAVRVMLLKQIF